MDTTDSVKIIADAMKTNPSCLAAICLAAIFAFLTFYTLQKSEERKSAVINLMLERCLPVKNMAL